MHDRDGLEILGRDECLRLLAAAPLGRIAVSRDALPSILPVNFRLWGEDVLFASGTGSKSLAVAHQDVIAFEVDSTDPDKGTGWSVLVVGRAEEVDPSDPEWAAMAAAVHPAIGRWATYLFRLRSERITGRRVHWEPELEVQHSM